ncbi:Hypothetical predicted protein [Mytilus galloprovincialis]|uniref:Uncharacterized protein n=1 Tax=Mytilus galloprovincialis TaxID=29158 RepID=A0A8B6EJS6_MYTGA|nr:Hypothetical predicted protein [Mytilus galloprovincialis]
MFLGKVNSDNNTILLNILDGITSDGIDGLTQYLFPNDKGICRLLTTDSESSFIELFLLFYRIGYVDDISNMSQCLKTRMFIESLNKSKYSTFIINVCKHHHAHISQYAAQLLPPPTITTETYNIQNRYHRFLQDGTKTDAVSGWLLYASFYYVTGQFGVTLRLIDYVLSRCSPDMIIFCHGIYDDRVKNNYRNHVHYTMTLNEKIRISTVSDIHYAHHSPLMPDELQLEVNVTDMFISPTVMSHCLRFLCYHHLGDIFNRQKALWDLYSTVNNKYFIRNHGLSVSMAILGVCFEISGDKDAACQCYDEVQKCDGFIIPSAKLRKKNF